MMLWTFNQYYEAYMSKSLPTNYTYMETYNLFHSNYIIITPDIIFKSNITFDKPMFQRANNKHIQNFDGMKYKKDDINPSINCCIPEQYGLIYFGNTVHAYFSSGLGLNQTENVWKIVEEYGINYTNPTPEEIFLLKMVTTNT